MQVSVAGKKVLVTAGAGGLGRNTAESFAAEGARVHVCDVSEEAVAGLRAAQPAIGTSLADVGDPVQVARLFQEARQHLGGGPDIVVNNVGVPGPVAAVEDLAISDWNYTIAVNLSGAFYCVREAVPAMKEAGGGVIINIATASVRTGAPLRVSYVASKTGLCGLTHNLARELGPFNIRVNTIHPGSMRNERNRRVSEITAHELGISYEQHMTNTLKYTAMRSQVDMQEVTNMILFLCSEHGRHITNQTISVDGHIEHEA